MRSLVTCCVLLAGIIFSCANDSDDDMQQRRVDLGSPFANNTGAQRKIPHRPRRRGNVGHPCKDSQDCTIWLCCRMNNGGGTCQRRSLPGQRCSDGQIKGGMYPGHCPCAYGEDHCKKGVCITYPWWRW
uniref:Ixodegrin B n=1 Tax=Rhipicephalus appendiculatus TaxID=34631 RepID=A0A131YSZ1_RHIAP